MLVSQEPDGGFAGLMVLIPNSGFDVEAYAMIAGELDLSGSTRYLGLTAVAVDVLT